MTNMTNVQEIVRKEIENLKKERIAINKKIMKIDRDFKFKLRLPEEESSLQFKKLKNNVFIFPESLIGKEVELIEDSIMQYIEPTPIQFERRKIKDIQPSDIPEQLDENQKLAFSQSIENNYTLIFGPPGSGKTFLIKKIIEHLHDQEEKIIVTAISNFAVDNIVRGLDHKKIKMGFADYEDEAHNIRKEIKELEDKKNDIISQIVFYKKKLVEDIKSQIEELQSEIENLRIQKAKEENSFFSFLKKSKVAALTETIKIKSEKKSQLLKEMKKLQEELDKIEKDLPISPSTPQHDIKTLESTLSNIESQLANLKSQIKSILLNPQIKVVGITLYSLLKLIHSQQISLDNFTVIIDEASQIPFPVITFIRNYSKRTIVVGDPNQLPPITNTGIHNIFEFEKTHVDLLKVRRFPKTIAEFVVPFYDRKIESIIEGGKVAVISPDQVEHIAQRLLDKGKEFMIATPYVNRANFFKSLGLPAETIHKLQGKEYDTVIFDIPKDSPFVSREMIIVAMTRSKQNLIIAINEQEFRNPYIKTLYSLLNEN
jgi:superfamily I DNA and/or RNA helicase